MITAWQNKFVQQNKTNDNETLAKMWKAEKLGICVFQTKDYTKVRELNFQTKDLTREL